MKLRNLNNQEKISVIIKHIKRVEDNCNALAKKLQESDFHLALKLIQRGRIHDASKFDDYEFTYLGNFEKEKPIEFIEALRIHHSKNPHHPEYWGINGIHCMTDLDLAEMVCDCVARGQEFGTDTRKWFYEKATVKYDFTMENECGKNIEKYLNMLLTKEF